MTLDSLPKIVSEVLPKVLIDARMVGEIPHGIARYITLLAKGLGQLKIEKELTYHPIFLTSPNTPSGIFGPFETMILDVSFLHPRELFEIPKLLKNLNPSIYHSPSFSSLWNCPCPSIVTIHDLNHLIYGDLSKKIYYWTLLNRFARRSKAIVTVSEFSRGEISNWLKIPEQNIDLVYNSIEANTSGPISGQLESFGLESREYFFCLSNSKPHKNLKTLIQAYQIFRKQQKNAWPLVLPLDSSTAIEGVREIGSQSESTVSTLLANTGGSLFPSLYEGFGLPPVEAAVAGSPLAVSRIPSHQEGLIDLDTNEVLWTEPRDLHGWVNAFHRLMKNEIPKPSLESRQRILNRFSTKSMAQTMDLIYQRVLQQSYS